jgi:DNA polymerase IV
MPMVERQGLTLLGLTFTNLENADAVQLALPLERRPATALDIVLDDVRERYGTTAITRAVLLGRDQGITMPLLPD